MKLQYLRRSLHTFTLFRFQRIVQYCLFNISLGNIFLCRGFKYTDFWDKSLLDNHINEILQYTFNRLDPLNKEVADNLIYSTSERVI